MTSLTDLPPELLVQIIEAYFLIKGSPLSLMLVNSAFYIPARHLLHSRLRFTSNAQLAGFAARCTPCLACPIQSIELDLAGGATGRGLFALIRNCLSRCRNLARDLGQVDNDGRMLLDSVRFCMNSHVHDVHENLQDAIGLINPVSFTWTGPDPPHHFSTAIVPGATEALFTALPRCSRLETLTLCSISFPAPVNSDATGPFVLPRIPSLRRLHIGQAVFLDPKEVARFALGHVLPTVRTTGEEADSGSTPHLEKIRLVDVYKGSIWGPRVRRSDVMEAGMKLWEETRSDSDPLNDADSGEGRAVRRALTALITCEARSERIIGGDRVAESGIMLD
ncbi:hypothetical protein EV122DRAFT_211086 [Schizophyllum commune]